MSKKLEVGDKVAYSVQWLKSVGMSHSYLARARGVITKLIPLGSSPSTTTIAVIDWKDDEVPAKVNTANLAKVGLNRKFQNID